LVTLDHIIGSLLGQIPVDLTRLVGLRSFIASDEPLLEGLMKKSISFPNFEK